MGSPENVMRALRRTARYAERAAGARFGGIMVNASKWLVLVLVL
jgi:hypothetical protein